MPAPSSSSTTGNNYLQYQTPSTGLVSDGGDLGYITPSTGLQNPTGPTESPGTSSGSTTPGLFSQVGNSLSSLIGGVGANAGNLALYGGLYSLLAGQASSAASENEGLAGQISAIGQPAVGESQNLLGAYSGGELGQPFASQLSAALNANQNTANTESQQSAQLLANAGGGSNLTGAMAGQQQQISQAQTQANTQAVSNAFTSELSASNSLLSAGGPYVQAGVAQEIQSNTALQGQLAQLMAALAQAYAQSTSGTAAQKPASGTGAGTGGGTGTGAGTGTGINPPTNLGNVPGAPGLPTLPDYTAPFSGPPSNNSPYQVPYTSLQGSSPPANLGGYIPPNFGDPSGTVIAPQVGANLPSYDPQTGLPYQGIVPPDQISYVSPDFGDAANQGGDGGYGTGYIPYEGG